MILIKLYRYAIKLFSYNLFLQDMHLIIKDHVEKSQNDFYLAFKNRMTQIMKDM